MTRARARPWEGTCAVVSPVGASTFERTRSSVPSYAKTAVCWLYADSVDVGSVAAIVAWGEKLCRCGCASSLMPLSVVVAVPGS